MTPTTDAICKLFAGESVVVAGGDVTRLALMVDDAKEGLNLDGEQTILVSEYGNPHIVGDESCTVGWCDGGRTYPARCDCGGLIHADFGDESSDGDFWLYLKCDRCHKCF